MLAEVKNLKDVKKKITEYDEIFSETDYVKRSEKAQSATDKFYDLPPQLKAISSLHVLLSLKYLPVHIHLQ